MGTPDKAGHLQAVSPEGDAELRAMLDGLGRGERAAAGRFFDRFEAEVNRIVWSLLGADQDHDDVVSDAFGAMLTGAHRLRSVTAVRGWVRAVTVNAVRQELRRRRWRRLFAPEEEGLSHPDAAVADDATRERARRLLRVLARLGTEERLVLTLRHLEGYELTELAEATGVSLATAKRRLARAQARLDAELDAEGPR